MSEYSTRLENHETSFVMIKPDGLHRGLAGKIISRFEAAGLRVVAVGVRTPGEELAREHYGPEIAERHGEKVREDLVDYIKTFPVMPMVVKGRNAVEKLRNITGDEFNPMVCPSGSVRSDYSSQAVVQNSSHGRG